MYYAIELYEKEDITLKSIKNSQLEEMVEDIEAFKRNRSVTRNDNVVVIKDDKMIAAYYKNEDKRNNMVFLLLNSGCDIYNYDKQSFIYLLNNAKFKDEIEII